VLSIAVVTSFVDETLVSLSDTGALLGLLDPPADTEHDRLRTLLGAMYESPYARIHAVSHLQVRRLEVARPIFPPRDISGTWTQTTPAYRRTDVHTLDVDRLTPLWIDLSADFTVTLVLEIDSGEVESILVREIRGITSLADFRSRFRYLDLDAFLNEHGITSVAELRECFEYLLTEVRLREQPPFDPDDPANERRFTLSVAILVRDTIDVRESLRAAKLARAILTRTASVASGDEAELELTAPYAAVVVFPQAAVGPSGFAEADLRRFFAIEDVVALFIPP
jgi:hypothetical protein